MLIYGAFQHLSGACGGTLSCSTCHVIFDPDEMSKLDLDEITDEEIEMLSISYSGRTETLVLYQ